MRVLAFIEARVLTGPGKNLIAFGVRARSFSELPIELTIATYERANPEDNYFLQTAKQEGLQTAVIRERGPFDPKVIPAIRELVKRVQPDIVQTHAVKSHFLMWVSGAWRQTPWVAFHHGYTSTAWRTQAYNYLDRISLRWPKQVVTVCEPFASEIQQQGVSRSRIRIIHNSIRPFNPPDAAVLDELRGDFGLPDGVPVVAVIGRLSREKGHSDLLKAVAVIRRNRADLQFRIVFAGDGPERTAVESEIRELGLEGTVVLCGHRNDIRPFYALASVIAMPSHSEGSPNVLLEALAAGTPVVATAVGGVPEIATHEATALLVPSRNPTSMAEAIIRLLVDHELAARLAKNGQREVLERFTPDAQLRAITNVYKDALAQQRNR